VAAVHPREKPTATALEVICLWYAVSDSVAGADYYGVMVTGGVCIVSLINALLSCSV